MRRGASTGAGTDPNTASGRDRLTGGRGTVGHYAQTMHGPTREALGDLSALALLLEFVPARLIQTVTHRIHVVDPF